MTTMNTHRILQYLSERTAFISTPLDERVTRYLEPPLLFQLLCPNEGSQDGLGLLDEMAKIRMAPLIGSQRYSFTPSLPACSCALIM